MVWRVWIYCRVANRDPNEPDTVLLNQQKRLEAYAENRGWDVVGVTAEYGSGIDPNRAGLSTVLEAAKAGRMDAILVQSMSRYTRDFWTTAEKILALKDQYGVELFDADAEMTASKILESDNAKPIFALAAAWKDGKLQEDTETFIER